MSSIPGRVRRIVTAQPAEGRSFIFSDDTVPTVFSLQNGLTLAEIWKTVQTPTPLRDDHEEPAGGELSLDPPDGGMLFRIADIPPDSEQASDSDSARELFEQMGAGEASTGGESHGALMHRTETLDFGIVLDGEITLVVDEGEVDLKTGDIVIQRGTNHGWSNRSDRSCRMAFIMIDAMYPGR